MRHPTAFCALLPSQVITIEATPAMWESGLHEDELEYVSNAVEKRRREFTAGRNCSRMALGFLGIKLGAIHVGTRRAPVFPAGISGTITHTNDYCAASVIRQGDVLSIGIDAESNSPLESGIRNLIMGPDELASIGTLPIQTDVHWDMLIFSAKEAFYKAYSQRCEVELDFLDTRVSLAPNDGTFGLRLLRADLPNYFTGQTFLGRYMFDERRVYTTMALMGCSPDQEAKPAACLTNTMRFCRGNGVMPKKIAQLGG